MINHVTYQLTPEGLKSIGGLMSVLGFQEVEPDDPFEHGYDVRWFKRAAPPLIHFVSEAMSARRPWPNLGLGHFCVMVSPEVYKRCAGSAYCSRNSGSGRIWLEWDKVRVEVRSS